MMMEQVKNGTRGKTPYKGTGTPAAVYGKIPPQAIQAECAVLGALLLDKHAIDMVVPVLPTAGMFYDSGNRQVYEAILHLHNTGSPVDSVTVAAELMKRGTATIGDNNVAYHLGLLTDDVVNSAHVEAHSYIVKEKYLLREIIRVGGSAITEGYDDSDPHLLLNRLQDELYRLTISQAKEVQHISTVLKACAGADEVAKQNGKEFTGIPTGNTDMDRCTGGWQPTDLVVIAARPAVGKTAWMLSTLYYAALAGVPVAAFSLEMPLVQWVKRMLSADSGVAYEHIKFPQRRSVEEDRRVLASMNKLAQAPIYLDETPGLTINELRAKAKRLKLKYGIRMLGIDYLQLMRGDTESSKYREQEISKISRELKALAKELEIPIIALSQLNRGVENRARRTYQLSDLRESGAIEQDADIVGFLHVPSPDDLKGDNELLHVAGLFIEKHRGGRCEKITYSFNKEIQRWGEYGKGW